MISSVGSQDAFILRQIHHFGIEISGCLMFSIYDLLLYWPILCSFSALAVVDLNPQELQYVSDHLTNQKCNELIDALNQKGFQLHPELFPVHTKFRGHPPRPCLVRLREWGKGQGGNMTFDFLALRLKEIGLEKVADKLSGLVLGETVRELHKFFLDDPYKDMVPTDSLMVDKQEDTTKMIPSDEGEDINESLFVAIVILTVICLTLFMCITVCLVCPRLGHIICQFACPTPCMVMYDTMINNCLNCWSITRRNMDKYMLVAPKGGGGLML
ncbi:uncharacterized protein LOC106071416 isoform X2 [Biomphalaria glabrata]|uniref:Uncharacterized protein LOC106071416 isoform X2 n=1 Tax=Biomphalaria glabrata TaxID=6526 RepID=A0A9W2YH81_BIOGL|nr:uncharacterized protein LOC106071416 isoform X2 [Biomphalaria glabrata]